MQERCGAKELNGTKRLNNYVRRDGGTHDGFPPTFAEVWGGTSTSGRLMAGSSRQGAPPYWRSIQPFGAAASPRKVGTRTSTMLTPSHSGCSVLTRRVDSA